MTSQWVTPALLLSLLADLRSSRAGLRDDFRELKQDVQTAIGGVNTRMDTMDTHLNHRMDRLSAGQQELNGPMDRLYQRLAPARQPGGPPDASVFQPFPAGET